MYKVLLQRNRTHLERNFTGENDVTLKIKGKKVLAK